MPSPTLAPTSTHPRRHFEQLRSQARRQMAMPGPGARQTPLSRTPSPPRLMDIATNPPIPSHTREPVQTRTYRDTSSSIQWNPPIYPRILRALNVSYALVMVIRLSLVRAVIRSVMHARTMAILPVYVHWHPNRNRGRVEGNPLHILAGPIWHYRRALKLSFPDTGCPVPDVSIYYMSNINELHDGILFHWFCKCTPPWMFLPLDIPSEYRPEHVTFGLLCVIFKFPSRIFCRRVPGFATDCPCGVWCRGLTTCLLYVGPPLEF